eukprot:3204666-Amphidinium_carterae.1
MPRRTYFNTLQISARLDMVCLDPLCHVIFRRACATTALVPGLKVIQHCSVAREHKQASIRSLNGVIYITCASDTLLLGSMGVREATSGSNFVCTTSPAKAS